MAVILLIVVAALLFMAEGLLRVCVAAIVATCASPDAERTGATLPDEPANTAQSPGLAPLLAAVTTLHSAGTFLLPVFGATRVELTSAQGHRSPQRASTVQAPAGPQDAPSSHLGQPAWRSPAVSTGPQDAPVATGRATASVGSTTVASRSPRWVVSSQTLEELADRLRLRLEGRAAASDQLAADSQPQLPTADRMILDHLPRPVTGPAYLGGRDDAAYLRGWDAGVDWIAQGNPERAASWCTVAYMTGWNDSLRAISTARRG